MTGIRRTPHIKTSWGNIFLTAFLFFLVFLFVFPLASAYSQEATKKNVLILNSYHKGYVWSDNIMEGISSILKEGVEDVDIHIDYMDTQRGVDSEHLENLLRLYRHKFRDRRFDVIISSDDTAFRFLLKHRDELFARTPFIFCGVNKFRDSMLSGQEKIAGIVETADFTSTFNLAMKLRPGLRHIFVVGNKTETGALILKDIKEIAPLYKGLLDFTFFEDYEIRELEQKLGTLGKDTAIFSLAIIKDKTGKIYSYNKSIELVARNSSVPVYSGWDFTVGNGALGGKMVNSYDHGREAGEMALKALTDKMDWDVPEVRISRTHYMFDYEQLKRFGIKLSALPEDSIIINQPSPFYMIQRSSLVLIAFFIILLGAVIFVLTVNILERRKTQKELQRKESELSAFIDNIPDIAWLKDRESRFIHVNRAFSQDCGFSTKELKGKTDLDIWSRENAELYRAGDRKIIEQRKTIRVEEPLTDKDGKKSWIETIKSPIFDSRGEVIGTVGISRDITKRKEREDETRKFKAISDNASFGVTIVDLDRNTIYANEAYARIHGYTVDELIGKHHSIFHNEETDRIAKDAMQRLRDEGSIKPFEEMHRRKDGSFFPAFIYTSLIQDEKGEPLYIASILTDITERKKVEEEIKKFKTISDNAGYGVVIFSTDRKMLYVNEAFARMHGYGVDELIGKNHSILHDEETEETGSEAIKELFQQGHTEMLEEMHKRKDGSLFPILIQASLVRDEKGSPLYVASIVTDMTEKKRAEEELKASLEEKEVLLQEVHHRVKNNMQVISSMLQLQSSFIENKEFGDILQLCQDRIMSMALVHEKIYQSKELANINFREYLETLTESLFSHYAHDREGIVAKLDVEDMFLDIDTAVPLGLIINELLTNTLKHAFKGMGKGEVFLSLHSANENNLELTVRDDGIGLPGDFDMKNPKSFGLQIVRLLAEKQLHGKIDIRGDGGAEFHLLLKKVKDKKRG